MNYTEKVFDLKGLKGLSEKQISEHYKLYVGYVKNLNSLTEKLDKMRADPNADAYVMAELKRRIGFEFNGMRLHDHYFGDLVGGNGTIVDGNLKKALASQYGSPARPEGGFENWLADFKATSMLRGTGWAILAYDADEKKFFNIWVNSHELGHLAGAKIILALDIWEHAFLFDHLPSQRKDYIDAYFSNINWQTLENKFNQ